MGCIPINVGDENKMTVKAKILPGVEKQIKDGKKEVTKKKTKKLLLVASVCVSFAAGYYFVDETTLDSILTSPYLKDAVEIIEPIYNNIEAKIKIIIS